MRQLVPLLAMVPLAVGAAVAAQLAQPLEQAPIGVVNQDGARARALMLKGKALPDQVVVVTSILADIGRIQAIDPQVLVLGNSLAETNVSVPSIRNALDTRSVRVLAVPGSVSAEWYAILKYQLFANGAGPRVVVIPTSIRAILAIPDSPREYERVTAYSTDPELERRLLGPSEVERAWGRLRVRGIKLRSAFLETWRNSFVGLALDGPSDPEPFGRRQIALDYGMSGVTLAGTGGVSKQAGIEASFLPDLVRLTRAHDSELVFALLPTRKDEYGSASEERAFADWVNEARVSVVDLRDVEEVTPADFRDQYHLSNGGRDKLAPSLSVALHDAVLDWSPHTPRGPGIEWVLTGTPPRYRFGAPVEIGPCRWRLVPLDAPVPSPDPGSGVASLPLVAWSEKGRLPQSSPDGTPCADGWSPRINGSVRVRGTAQPEVVTVGTDIQSTVAPWVLPGTTLRLEVPPGWVEGPPGDVWSAALVVVDGAGSPSFTLSGREVPVDREGKLALVSVGAPASADEGFTLSWTSPPDGPWLRLQDLWVGDQHAFSGPPVP